MFLEIKKISSAIRDALDACALNGSFNHSQVAIVFDTWPRGCCGHTAHVVGITIRDWLGIEGKYICGRMPHRDSFRTHAWLEVEGILVDITADQFGLEPVIVMPVGNSEWHNNWTDIEKLKVVTPDESDPVATISKGICSIIKPVLINHVGVPRLQIHTFNSFSTSS